jgi:hypothetical protein
MTAAALDHAPAVMPASGAHFRDVIVRVISAGLSPAKLPVSAVEAAPGFVSR